MRYGLKFSSPKKPFLQNLQIRQKSKKKNILKPRKATSQPLTVVITSFHAKYRPYTFLPYPFTSMSPSQYDISKFVHSTRIMYAHQVI